MDSFKLSLLLFQVGCSVLSFQRYKAGSEAAFTSDQMGGEEGGLPEGQYQTYGGEGEGNFNEAPFSGQQGTADGGFDRF